MQQLTSQLADAVNDENAMQGLLQQHKDFLLEPLEVGDDATTREERFETYRRTTTERIQTARSRTAKHVLQALQDFVLSFESQE